MRKLLLPIGCRRARGVRAAAAVHTARPAAQGLHLVRAASQADLILSELALEVLHAGRGFGLCVDALLQQQPIGCTAPGTWDPCLLPASQPRVSRLVTACRSCFLARSLTFCTSFFAPSITCRPCILAYALTETARETKQRRTETGAHLASLLIEGPALVGICSDRPGLWQPARTQFSERCQASQLAVRRKACLVC